MPAKARSRGCLFAIGGREARFGDELAVLEEFVSRSGGPGASVVVLTGASNDPDKRIREYGPAFRSLGVDDLSFFHQEDRAQAASPRLLEAVARADSVFLSGGNQLKLVTAIAGTPLETLLRKRFHAGMHLGGTSAGASVMSSVMIARGKARSTARLSSVRMSPGFGFVSGLIVDQHFRERDRFGRLLAAVACNPGHLGMGLDEDTAFALDAKQRLTVYGTGSLTIVDGAKIAATNIDVAAEDAPAAFAGMQIHVLTAGWTYDVKRRRVGPQPVFEVAPPEMDAEPRSLDAPAPLEATSGVSRKIGTR